MENTNNRVTDKPPENPLYLIHRRQKTTSLAASSLVPVLYQSATLSTVATQTGGEEWYCELTVSHENGP
jgi:hypothetical protein